MATTMQDGASTALVPTTSDGSVALYTDDSLTKELRRIANIDKEVLSKAASEKLISAGRFSAPVRIDRTKENASKNEKTSYNMLATFGSFDGWNCPSTIVKGDKAFLKLEAGKNISDTKGQVKMPVSKVLGMPIPYALLQVGDKRMIFTTSHNSTTIGNKRFAFAIAIRASYTIKEQTSTQQAAAAMMAASALPTTADGSVPLSSLGRGQQQQRPRFGNVSDRRGGYQSKLGPIVGISPPGPVGAPIAPPTVPAEAVANATPMDEDDYNDEMDDDATRFLRRAMAMLPEQSICTEPFLSDELKAAYLDDTSALTPGQRLMIEMKFPDVVPNKLPQAYQTLAPTFALNCDDVMSLQTQKYAGQDDRDMLELYRIDPEIETRIDPDLIINHRDSVMTMCVLQGDKADAMRANRMAEFPGKKAFFNTVKWLTSIEDKNGGGAQVGGKPGDKFKAPGQGNGGDANEQHPLLCYNRGVSAKVPKLSAIATITNWKKNTPYFAKCAACAEKGIKCEHQWRGSVTAFIDTFTPVLYKLGITTNANWLRFAPIIAAVTEIWLTMVVNEKRNPRISFNAHNMGTDTQQMVVTKVIDIVHDLAGALRKEIGIPVTPQMAAQLIGINYPTSAAVASAMAREISDVTNLTEAINPAATFATALAAECDFYVLTISKIHAANCGKTRDNVKDPDTPLPNPNYGCLAHITPEMGDSMFSGEWFDFTKTVVLPSTGREIQPNDMLRMRTGLGSDLSDPNLPRLVFAVRKEEAASAERAKRNIEIFRCGAKYDPVLGLPIKEGDASPPGPLLAIDQPVAPKLQAITAGEQPPNVAVPQSTDAPGVVAPPSTAPTDSVLASFGDLSAADLDFDDDSGTAPPSLLPSAAPASSSRTSTRASSRAKMPSASTKTDESASTTDRKRTRSRSPAPPSKRSKHHE